MQLSDGFNVLFSGKLYIIGERTQYGVKAMELFLIVSIASFPNPIHTPRKDPT